MQSEACEVLLLLMIHCLLQSFSRSKKEFETGFHVSTWSKLLSTLIPSCFCRSVSIPSRTFLCCNPLYLATISAFPQSAPLWHSTVCRARPPSSLPIRFSADRVFPLRSSSFVSVDWGNAAPPLFFVLFLFFVFVFVFSILGASWCC